MWTYKQKTGELLRDGVHVVTGYSGHGEGLNNPAMDDVKSVGPIPRGRWRLTAPYFDTRKGPFVMRLLPKEGTVTHGRAGFLIHGDSIQEPGTASLGCIILPRPVRIAMWESDDHDLEVVSGEECAVNVA